MPRETQAYKLARFRDRVDNSRQWREDRGYIDTWRRVIDLYRGRVIWDTPDGSPDDQAMVNMAFAVLNIVVSSVTTQYPKFTVAPNVIGQDDKATIAEGVLNYAWKHYNFHDEFQLAVIDMCMVGHGWLKVGWHYEEEHKRQTNATADEQQAEMMQRSADAERQAAAGAPGAPTDEQIAQDVGPNMTTIEVIKDDPFVERVSPFDVVVDPEATCERDLRWIAHRTVRDIDKVRKDPLYDAAARKAVQADLSLGREDDSYRRDEASNDDFSEGDDSDRVTVWEMYDLQDNTWATFAGNGDGFLRKPDDIPTELFKNPFVMFRDYDVPDVFYPIGEIESMESLQEELNKTRTQQINSRKQYVRKFIARESALDERAREALMSERDGDVALIGEDDRPLNDVIVPAPALTFDPQMFNAHSQQIVNDMQMTTGLSDYQFGQMPSTRRLATEAMAVEGSTNARSSFKLTRVERCLATCGRYLLAVMQQFMDQTRVARVAGPGGEMLFEYTSEDIEGEYDLNVEAGSTQPKNDMIRRQEAVTLFNTLAPYMGTLINPQELLRYLLQQGYDIKNVERFMVEQPPPQPQMGPDGQPMMGPDGQPMEPGAGGASPVPGQGLPPGAPPQGGGAPGGAPPGPPAPMAAGLGTMMGGMNGGGPQGVQPPIPAGV